MKPEAERQREPHGATDGANAKARAGSFLHRLRGRNLLELAGLTLQLVLILAVIRGFRIQEDFGFLRLVPVILVGFVLNAVSPQRLRLPLFALLSLLSIGIVLPFPSSLILVAIGLGLIGVCHLPIPFAARAALLVAAGLLLAAMRAGWLAAPRVEIPTLVLPVLAAMFMFRLAVYLHEMRHERQPDSLWERLSYFFMLPNVCFLLFPVVDYRKFRRTYYDGPAHDIYQKGLSWMLRGLLQLLAYRVVYQYFVPAPSGVQDLWTFLQFMLSTYLLYLHISGQFHLIVGILCLFGFNLPTTHHLYYLAPSINSFWRRINIYWRDFMTKLVFYPTFAGLGRYSMTVRLVGATMIVFIGTWLLHSYQAFWLRGDFPLESRDAIFWGVLGVLVVFNSLRELKTPKAAKSQDVSDTRRALSRSLGTVGTFGLICVLWSLWSTSGVDEWAAYASKATNSSVMDVAMLLLLLLAVVAFGTGIQLLMWRAGSRRVERWDLAESRPALYTVATSLLLVAVMGAQDAGALSGSADAIVSSLRQNRLNVRDQELADRGYYEGVVDAGSFASALWKAHLRQPPGTEWAFITDVEFVEMTDDLLEYRLISDYEGSWRDAPFNTNSRGFRDTEYPFVKPPGTVRIVFLGASFEMGAGVEEDQTFPELLEETLNREHSQPGRRYEVLNLSVGGYGLVQRAELLRQEVYRYEPDLLILTLYSSEERRLLNHLTHEMRQDAVETSFLQQLARRAQVKPQMSRPAARQALQPYSDEVIAWALQDISEQAASRQIPLIGLTMRTIQDLETAPSDVEAVLDQLRELARGAGIPVLHVDRDYQGYSLREVRLAPWDLHLSVLGHQLIADGVHRVLVDNESTLGLGLGPATTEQEMSSK